MGTIELPVVYENKLLIELVKQYGQLSTAFVQSSRDHCAKTEGRLKVIQDLIERAST